MIGLKRWTLKDMIRGWGVVDHDTGRVVCLLTEDAKDVMQARGRLIEAAPELKAALQRLAHASAGVQFLIDQGFPKHARELHNATIGARNALRKAVGL